MLRDRSRIIRPLLSYAVLFLALTGIAHAQTPPNDLKARLDAGDRQIQELKAILLQQGIQPAAVNSAAPPTLDDTAVKKIVAGYMVEKEQQQQQAAAAAVEQQVENDGFKVGSDLRLDAHWDLKSGFTVETPHKDFSLHVGAEFMEDSVWFTQSPALKPAAQVGDLQDGTFFRRIRIFMDGSAWQVFEWTLIFAVEQVKEGIPNLSEFWVGEKDIPWVGRARVGQLRLPQGLEGDTSASSRAMTFMEASPMTDAFYQRFGTGVWALNTMLDERATWSAMAYRQTQALHDNNGADFGDGKYAVAGRLTCLPLYEHDGRCLLHLGVSGNWRKAENADPGLIGPGVVQFRARPELRDATGDYGGATNGSAVNLPGDTRRMVDTGVLSASSSAVLGTEVFFMDGPFSAMAEWAYVVASDVAVGTGAAATRQDRSFNGGYVQVGYFLTGENRTYNTEYGRMSRTYLTGPNSNFWLTRDEDGHMMVGRGAVELAARWSYLNLNDGPVQGGVLTGTVVGLNWFLNPNTRIEFNYTDDNRYSLKPGQSSGVVQGLGTRLYLQF